MADINGRCLCGNVTYSASVDPLFVGVCHCTSCQKITGTAFASVIAVPTAALAITGETTNFDGVGDSGKATHRAFCPTCGSTVTESADVMAGITMLTIGTLSDPSLFKPDTQIYCDSALPWAVLPNLNKFPKMPG